MANFQNYIEYHKLNGLQATQLLAIPSWPTSGRPSGGDLMANLIGINTDVSAAPILEWYDGTTWHQSGAGSSSADGNNYPTGITFTSGTLAIQRSGLADISVSLDGRYLQSYTETDPVFSASFVHGITSIGSGLQLSGGTLSSTITQYTDALARASISLTTTGSGAATYNTTTGALNIPTPSGISSISLTTPNTVFSTPISFTNSSGAWSGALSLNSQVANTFFAAPNGSSGTPSFRAIASTDISSLFKTVNGNSLFGTGDISTITPPAGSNTQIQFNNSGAFGASSNLTWASNQLGVTGQVIVNNTGTGSATGINGVYSYVTHNFNGTGSTSGAVYASNSQFFQANINFSQSLNGGAIFSGLSNIVRLGSSNTSTGTYTLTMGSGRAFSANATMLQLSTLNNSGVVVSVDNAAGLQIYAPQAADGNGVASNLLASITNYYGIFIAPYNEYANSAAKITNGYGIYQAGTSDKNYFGGDIYFNKIKPVSTQMVTIDSTGKLGAQVIPSAGSSITLTTVGTSGPATFDGTTLNIPNYTYTLPTASTSVLGGVKVDGTSITISSGVISAVGGGSLPSLAQNHFYVGNASSTPVDAGTGIQWDGTNLLMSAGGEIRGGSSAKISISDGGGSFLEYGTNFFGLGGASANITVSGNQRLGVDNTSAWLGWGGGNHGIDLIHADGTVKIANLNDSTGVAKMVTVNNGVLGYQAIPSGGGASVTSGTYSSGTLTLTKSDASTVPITGFPTDNSSLTNGAGYLTASDYASGSLIDVKYITAGTTYTPTSGTTRINFILIGGGGGGGGVTGAASSVGAGAGGAGGGILQKSGVSVSSSTTYTVAIGAAGTAGANTGTNGGAGGNTSITIGATTYTANGGGGGGGQTAGTTAGVTVGGQTNGTSANGDINGAGTNGDNGIRLSGTVGISGAGGTSTFGVAGYALGAAGAGINASGYGAGGGGALSTANANRAGGTGSQGIIIIYEFK